MITLSSIESDDNHSSTDSEAENEMENGDKFKMTKEKSEEVNLIKNIRRTSIIERKSSLF